MTTINEEKCNDHYKKDDNYKGVDKKTQFCTQTEVGEDTCLV